MQSRGFHPSRPGCYFASSFVEKLYVTAISPAKAQPIAPAGVGARATPARVKALAQMLTGFGSAASAEDMDSDSRSASTSFFMTSPFFQSIRDTSIGSSKRSSKAHRRQGRPSGARSTRNQSLLCAAYAAAYPWSKTGTESQLARAELL